ncbi:hypothetical protein FOQG_11072 [Fusarium oxysporum f. sp. raphani 54005]|uniref:Uncharacterized protein n=1 Tax=Fusarium oxysporum f. sp. raphani 54005 TaxID=1089458 RepID=X0BRM8_FUSOX|nr:hypothetical protein FOQG_11072 [Fusarium oxysporum f. sp. raphani 54005]
MAVVRSGKAMVLTLPMFCQADKRRAPARWRKHAASQRPVNF